VLEYRYVFLTVLEAGKSKIRMPADLVPVGPCFLACRQPSSSCVLTWQRERRREKKGGGRERERERVLISLWKLYPHDLILTNDFPKACLLTSSHCGVKASTYECWGHSLQSIIFLVVLVKPQPFLSSPLVPRQSFALGQNHSWIHFN
jgi:hypothetical protein